MDRTPFVVVRDGIPGWGRSGRFYPVMAGAEEPPTSSEPAAEPDPTTPVAEPELTGPWAQDLERAFEDPQVRGQVNDFMRTTYQPYVTGLETKAAELEQAAGLVNDLRENPVETYLELTKVFGGDDLVAAVQQFLTLEQQEEVAEHLNQQTPVDPELEEIKRERREQRALEEYEAQLAELDVDPDIFHPLVVSHEGDIAAAYAAYPAYIEQVKKALGIETQVSEDDIPDPPSVLGSDTRAGSTPPLENKPKSMDEALDNFFASQAPQTVGTA